MRRAAAAAFAAPRLQPSVAPRRPRWRRHLPMLAFALALALLVLAAARPQRTVAVPVERASIMLATDVSGSMLATDVKPNRLIAAKRAARAFLDQVPASVNVGVLAFNNHATVLQSPTRSRADVARRDRPHGGQRRHRDRRGDRHRDDARCATSPGEDGRRPPGAIVLISDGTSTSGRDPVAAARAAAQTAHPDLHRRARHRPRDDPRARQRRRARDRARPARPAGARRDRARLGRRDLHRRRRPTASTPSTSGSARSSAAATRSAR